MIDRIQHLERRIQSLEAGRRRWRAGAVVAMAMLGAAVVLGTARRQNVQDEVQTRRIVVVDENNTPRIVIGQDPEDMQRISRSCGITIHDKTGAERFGVGVMENDVVNMGFDAAAGVGHPMRDRLALGVSPKGEPYVMLINNETKVPVRLIAEADGTGGIEFLDYDKANSKVIIRRISFKGDDTKAVPHEFPKEEKKR